MQRVDAEALRSVLPSLGLQCAMPKALPWRGWEAWGRLRPLVDLETLHKELLPVVGPARFDKQTGFPHSFLMPAVVGAQVLVSCSDLACAESLAPPKKRALLASISALLAW